MSEFLKDFKPGPLDFYRRKASFDWKQLKCFLETEEIVKYEQTELMPLFRDHPEFKQDFHQLTMDSLRRKTNRQYFIYKNTDIFTYPNFYKDKNRLGSIIRTTVQYSLSLLVKNLTANGLFIQAIKRLGTERHAGFLNAAEEGKLFGCYCMTEIGHGSNVSGIQTTATYNPTSDEFILHTPDFEAAKCWAGALGQMASHAAVYAQLILNEENYGYHVFLVPIRDPHTLIPYPGIVVGDMGEKIGLNGVDNGFLAFNNYTIPRTNLLNKLADVTNEGEYIAIVKNPKRRLEVSLGSLSAGRIMITVMAEGLATKALTIALRYAGVRKQFGPNSDEEVPILEYQTHQHRLLPYMAGMFVMRLTSTYLAGLQSEFWERLDRGEDSDYLAKLGMELHVLSSVSKPVSSWLARDAIQECRECCGGHGYLKISALGDIRNDNDVNLTYEGENHVLIQQTSNWLLKLYKKIQNNEKIETLLHSVDFLTNYSTISHNQLRAKIVEDICRVEEILSAFQWLVCYLLKLSHDKLESNLNTGNSRFTAKNNCQVFYAKNLAIAYFQHFLLQQMYLKINEAPNDNIRNVLSRLFGLYGLTCLKTHVNYFYMGKYTNGSTEMGYLLQEGILKLCAELKDDSISLIDTIAPADCLVNSILGMSDGNVYKNFKSALLRTPNTMNRPEWWSEIVSWKDYAFKNKL